jgi:glycolate oxidase FAD binding subunit
VSEVAKPASGEEVARALMAARAEGRTVRVRGGGTKLGWGRAGEAPDIELHTGSLHRIVEHNVGDLTAVVQAGVPLARAQAKFAAAGQMLALDPPLGFGRAATIGGVFATADSGPLRHRYGGPRDLIIGITVALSDGTVARAGGNVIKNVAGYDLAKLFTGSFGTLGAIVSVNVRLHPRPPAFATAVGSSADPGQLGAAARALAAAPLELDSLDVAWRGRRGGLLARVSGAEPGPRAERAAGLLREQRLEGIEVVCDDAELWARQRAGQRAREGTLVRLATRPSALPEVLGVARFYGATLVGRAAVGISYMELDPFALAPLRERLQDARAVVVLDGPAELRRAQDPWGIPEARALELMRQVKGRFDPTATCSPNTFVGGI